jgi:hypothetical protein
MKLLAYHPLIEQTGTTRSTAFSPVVMDFGRSERDVPSLRANTMRIERAYDRASASSYESAWERFVVETADTASEYQLSEIDWLLDRILNGTALPYRRALSLVQAAGAIADVRKEISSRFATAFAAMLAHPVAEVRAAALEATCDADIGSAKQLAQGLLEDASPVVRETARAILAMMTE